MRRSWVQWPPPEAMARIRTDRLEEALMETLVCPGYQFSAVTEAREITFRCLASRELTVRGLCSKSRKIKTRNCAAWFSSTNRRDCGFSKINEIRFHCHTVAPSAGNLHEFARCGGPWRPLHRLRSLCLPSAR